MSAFILTNTRFWADGCDLTGAANKVEVMAEVEAKDATTYASGGWREQLGGLASSTWKASGFWEAGDPSLVDDALWSTLGGIRAVTAVPTAGAVGDVAYLTNALHSTYAILGDIGEVAPWSGEFSSSWPLVRGVVAHPAGTARTATGPGTALQLGAVAAGQRAYVTAHVLSVAGTTPSLTVRVESDDNAGFTSPTTRATLTAATSTGGQIARTDGTAITDTYWRVAWTISGTGPSFLFAAALGIK